MIKNPKGNSLTEIATQAVTPYDSRPLAAALATLSLTEIEAMLVNISSLELQIAKLNIAGHEDAMMHVVTDGLNRLTYLLDAVKMHKAEIFEHPAVTPTLE